MINEEDAEEFGDRDEENVGSMANIKSELSLLDHAHQVIDLNIAGIDNVLDNMSQYGELANWVNVLSERVNVVKQLRAEGNIVLELRNYLNQQQ